MAKYYITACDEFYSDISSNRSIQTHLAEIQSVCPKYIQSLLSHPNLLRLKHRERAIDTLNSIVTAILKDDTLPDTIDARHGSDYDIDDMKSTLGNAYVTVDMFDWNVMLDSADASDDVIISFSDHKQIKNDMNHDNSSSHSKNYANNDQNQMEITISSSDTAKSDFNSTNEEFTGYKSKFEDIDLSFRPLPIRDKSKLWDVCYDDCDREMKVYHSYPIIPTKQNEITITTPYDEISDVDLMRLFPDHFIHTRLKEMYEPREGFTLHPKLGFIPKITGFTEEQVIDNIIKYPRFAHIFRLVDDPEKFQRKKRVAFISRIEVDGKLLNLKEAIKTVEDMKCLPNLNVFYFDYIMRRYLLERDYHTVEHKYPLDGYLQPFTVLFMTPEEYAEFGYTDPIDLAKQCVKHRVQFYQSVHPLTRERYFPRSNPRSHDFVESRDCIFAETCDRFKCDLSCGQDIMYNYIREKSGIRALETTYDEAILIKDLAMLANYNNELLCFETPDVIEKTREFVYIYACKLRGVNANLIHISFSSYIQQLRDSWSYGATANLEHIQVRLRKWTVAVISGIDYCMFKDFEAQTLLNIIESRRMSGLTTIILTRSLTNIHGNSVFLSPLKEQLKEVLVHDRIN